MTRPLFAIALLSATPAFAHHADAGQHPDMWQTGLVIALLAVMAAAGLQRLLRR